jgi:organic radical activating enzyme
VTYDIAERFKSVQGEGTYTGTPMAFIRFVGCSVGKKTCHACDTDFEKTHSFRNGGSFSPKELIDWSIPYKHICLTGGEPFDQILEPIFLRMQSGHMLHIETSGTVRPTVSTHLCPTWICVSPKPGFIEELVLAADEIKVIVPGLGSGPGWPQLADAIRWAEIKPDRVFLQPLNGRFDLNRQNLRYVLDLIREYPMFRLSLQLHKILGEQ